MSIPSVNFCVVCEGVRPEPNGKANILGFYGVLPHVHILVAEIEKHVKGLVFLLGLKGPSDEVRLKASILNDDETPLIATPEQPFPLLPSDTSGLAGFAFEGITFKKPGTFYFMVTVGAMVTFKQPFTIAIGQI